MDGKAPTEIDRKTDADKREAVEREVREWYATERLSIIRGLVLLAVLVLLARHRTRRIGACVCAWMVETVKRAVAGSIGESARDCSDGESPLIVVAGPTASGKTALALRLAEALDGEIVSCDSVAVYRLMEIGTAKPSPDERARVPHHCLDLYWPDEACTAGDYARQARAAIADIHSRGHLPIVAGGTGLYLRALLQGLAPAPPRDEALRERLRGMAARRGAGYLRRVLRRVDAKAAEAIHANDTPKLVRSIEVTLSARRPQSEQWSEGRESLQGFNVLHFALGPSREVLYARINERAARMFEHGLVAETEMLRERYGDACRPLGSLGYAQAMSVLRGESTLDSAVALAQQGHRNYAKRQMTWFRRESAMQWLEGCGDESDVQAAALEEARRHVESTRIKAHAQR